MNAGEIRKIAGKCQVGINGGRHGRPFETEVVLPEIPTFDRIEISNALLNFADVVERAEKLNGTTIRTATGLMNYTMCHELIGYLMTGMGAVPATVENGSSASNPDENKVYGKYRILDAKTGEDKKGRYFVLKLDADDPEERKAVFEALLHYSMEQARNGRAVFARDVLRYATGGEAGS